MVTVVMTCYNPTPDAPRNRYARRCLVGLAAHLKAPEPTEYHIADDGSPGGVDDLREFACSLFGAVTSTSPPHNGIGSSLNAALSTIVGPWMYTTDDWLLTAPLDLALPLYLLEMGYDLVRLGPIHPNLQCRTAFTSGHGWWLDIDSSQGGYAFATRPFLASPRLLSRIGPFDEGLNAYDTERLYAERCAAAGIPIAAVTLAGPWEHIGEFEVGDLDVFHLEKVPV